MKITAIPDIYTVALLLYFDKEPEGEFTIGEGSITGMPQSWSNFYGTWKETENVTSFEEGPWGGRFWRCEDGTIVAADNVERFEAIVENLGFHQGYVEFYQKVGRPKSMMFPVMLVCGTYGWLLAPCELEEE